VLFGRLYLADKPAASLSLTSVFNRKKKKKKIERKTIINRYRKRYSPLLILIPSQSSTHKDRKTGQNFEI